MARVLLIDDEPALLRALRRVLADHEVVIAGSAEEGLDALEAGAQDFDLLLCDVEMPGLGGVGFWQCVASRRPDLLPRIVFMSAGAFSSKAEAFIEEQRPLLMRKPFEIEQLREMMRAVIRTGRPR